MRSWRQWWREPLVHFLVLGGMLFALYRWQNPSGAKAGVAPREIVITTGRIANLAESFSRVWQRLNSQLSCSSKQPLSRAPKHCSLRLRRSGHGLAGCCFQYSGCC